MSRFFSFGCSFTEYVWPTWADIVGDQYDYYENWGRGGGGNQFIFNSLIECHARNTLTKDDTVIIMWSNVLREDRFFKNWVLPGNIYTQEYYDKEFVKKFVTIRGCYVRDLAFMSAADIILSSIECEYHFLSMVDIVSPDNYNHNDQSDEIKDILETYSSTVNKIKPSVHKTVFNYDWYSRGYRTDYHPRTREHLEYLDQVLPEISIAESTRKLIVDDKFVLNHKKPHRFGS
jgi:hypothetical protein